MAVTPRVELGDAALVKNWYIDIDSGYPDGAVTWIPISGVVSFKADTPATFKDASTFDDGGWASQQKTGGSWKVELTVKRAPQAAALASWDAGQELLRVAGSSFGSENRQHVRWYEVNNADEPLGEAWEGVAAVSWTEDKSAVDDIRSVKVELMGQGPRVAVTPHPNSV